MSSTDTLQKEDLQLLVSKARNSILLIRGIKSWRVFQPGHVCYHSIFKLFYWTAHYVRAERIALMHRLVNYIWWNRSEWYQVKGKQWNFIMTISFFKQQEIAVERDTHSFLTGHKDISIKVGSSPHSVISSRCCFGYQTHWWKVNNEYCIFSEQRILWHIRFVKIIKPNIDWYFSWKQDVKDLQDCLRHDSICWQVLRSLR